MVKEQGKWRKKMEDIGGRKWRNVDDESEGMRSKIDKKVNGEVEEETLKHLFPQYTRYTKISQ